MTRLSFDGDPARKERYLVRLRDHIDAGDFRFAPAWEDGKGSALGCTVEADDIDVYADRLGVPAALAMVLDNLVNCQPPGPMFRHATDFALRWLTMMPVGADLSPVPGTILCELLDHPVLRETTQRHPPVEAVRRVVIDLHRSALDGQDVSRTQWREARRHAVRTTDAAPDGLTGRAAGVIEAAAWPHATRSALRDTLDALSRLADDKAMRDIGWTTAEEATTFEQFDVIFHEKAAVGENLVGEDLLAELTRRDPALGARFAERNQAMMISRNVHIEAGNSILRQFRAIGAVQGRDASVMAGR